MAAYWPQAVLGSFKANADLSNSQYTLVKLATDGGVVAVSAITDIPIGVLQNTPKQGQTAEVVIVGGTKVKAAGAISLPALLGAAADGRIAKVTLPSATVHIFGQADEAATAANDIVSAVVNFASPARAV